MWAIYSYYMKNANLMILIKSILLVFGGFLFVVIQDWLILPIVAIIWFLVEYWNLEPSKRKKLLIPSFVVGIFLMVFDFIIENLGFVYGFWESMNSHLFVLYVPIEVMLTCVFGAAAWAIFSYANHKNKFFIILNTIIWSIGGTAGEWFLNLIGFMSYGNGWLSLPHAFISYIITFLILHSILYKIGK